MKSAGQVRGTLLAFGLLAASWSTGPARAWGEVIELMQAPVPFPPEHFSGHAQRRAEPRP
jgi:hypothetical protein